MKALLQRLLLGVSGTLLLAIGSAVLFYPHSFAATNGVVLSDGASLLSEYRAPGGLLVASAVLILHGAMRASFVRWGFALSALVYGSYGVSRVVALTLDGMPSTALVQAMAVELVLGITCLAVFLRLSREPVLR